MNRLFAALIYFLFFLPVDHPGHGIADGFFTEFCRIRRIPGDDGQFLLRAVNSGSVIPSRKDEGAHGWDLVGRRFTDQVFLGLFVIVDDPGDDAGFCLGIDLFEDGRVNGVFPRLRYRGIPADETEPFLRRLFLARIVRPFARRHLGRLQNDALFKQPGYRIHRLDLFKDRRIGSVSRYPLDLGIPADEFISFLGGSGTGREHPFDVTARVADSVDDPGDGVLLVLLFRSRFDDNGIDRYVDRRIGRVGFGRRELRGPAGEDIPGLLRRGVTRHGAGRTDGGLRASVYVPGDRIPFGNAVPFAFPQRILGDDLLLFQAFDLLQLPSGFCLLFQQSFQRFRQRLLEIFGHPVPGCGILGDLHLDKGRDVVRLHAQEPGVRPFPGLVGVIDLEDPDLPLPDHQGAGGAGDRVDRHALGVALQDPHTGLAIVDLLDIDDGAPDAGDHGGGADIQLFVLFQRGGDVAVHLAAFQKQLQALAAAPDLQAAAFIQLHRLFGVQCDPGIAGLLGGDHVAAVQAHIFPGAVGLSAGAGDVYRSLRLEQTDLGAGIVRCQRRDRQAQAQAETQQPDEAPSQGSAEGHVSAPLSDFCVLFFYDTLE